MFIQNIIMDIICLLCFVKRIGECPNGENNLCFGFVNKSYISYFFIIWLIVINRFIHFWHRKWFHHHRVACFCLAQGTGTAPDRRRRSRGVPLCRAFRRLPTARCTETRRRPGLGEDVLRFCENKQWSFSKMTLQSNENWHPFWDFEIQFTGSNMLTTLTHEESSSQWVNKRFLGNFTSFLHFDPYSTNIVACGMLRSQLSSHKDPLPSRQPSHTWPL